MEIQSEDVPGSASEVVAACEEAWRAFQRHHRELPDVVIILGSGVERGRLVKLGHWWGGRWETAGELRGEVLLAGEALHLPAEDVFEVLLHEAAHGLNAARGVKDTSRAGRYHNARFKAAAVEVGLVVSQIAPYGWAETKLSPAALERYSGEIDGLRSAVKIARRFDARKTGVPEPDGSDGSDGGSESGGRSGRSALSCGCGRLMRMAPKVAALGPVVCGVCGNEFASREVQKPMDAGRTAARVVHVRPVAATATVDEMGPEVVAAEDVLRDAADRDGGLVLVAKAAAWEQAHGEALDESLAAADDADAAALNELAGAFRRLHGRLSGPDVNAGGLRLAAGDQVVVRSRPGFGRGGGDGLPDVGVLGQVIAVEVGGSGVAVDFATAGRCRISLDDAGRHLGYGYAEVDDDAMLPLRTSAPPVHPGMSGLVDGPGIDDTPLAEVIEIGLP